MTFTFHQPVVEITLTASGDDAKPQQSPAPGALPVLTAVIEQAAVRVREPESGVAVVDLQDINLTMHLRRDPDQGSLFVVDPVTLFEHQAITPELCGAGLQLVAPLLASEIDARGEFSFRLEALQVPLATDAAQDQLVIAGVVQLHEASVALKDSIVAQLVSMIGSLLGTEIQDRLSVVKETAVRFHVADARVHHEGFAMVLPHREDSIRLGTRGSVGLDGSLDLHVQVVLPRQALGESPLARFLGAHPIEFQVQGTLREPEIGLAENADWLQQVQQLLTSEQVLDHAGELVGRTADLVGELLSRRSEREQGILPRFRDRIRQRRPLRWTDREFP